MTDSALEHFQRSYPAEAVELAHHAWQELCSMQTSWGAYRDLYCKSKETVELLNYVSGTFFVQLQHVLMRDIFLAITRLTDPSDTRKKPNASMRRLQQVLGDCGVREPARVVGEALARLEKELGVFRQHRNKGIAHRDLRTLPGPGQMALPDVSVKKVGAIVSAIGEAFNAMDTMISKKPTYFDLAQELSGIDDVIAVLRIGRDALETGWRRP